MVNKIRQVNYLVIEQRRVIKNGLHDRLLSKAGRMEVATEQLGAYMVKGLLVS